MQFYFDRGGFHPGVAWIAPCTAPMNLIGVCRLWRSIALKTSALWESIDASRKSVDFMRHWLRLSGDGPIRLRLTSLSRSKRDSDDQGTMLGLILGVGSRVQSLSLTLTTELALSLEHFLQDLEYRKTPLLITDLDVTVPPGSDETSMSVFKDILLMLKLSSFMCLKRLRLDNPYDHVRRGKIPWSQLEVVKTNYSTSFKELLCGLLQCTSATTIEFDQNVTYPYVDPSDYDLQIPTKTLDRLTSLTLSLESNPMRLTKYFMFPSLRSLRIGIRHRDYEELERLLQGSPHLEALYIDDYSRIPKHIEDCGAPPMDQGVVQYLTCPYIRRIPHVEITFPKAYSRCLDIIQSYPTRMDVFPQFLCWTNSQLQPYIGWAESLEYQHQVLWQYDGYEFHLAPEFGRLAIEMDEQAAED